MRPDVGLPIQGSGSRNEILLVSYDGFIKNTSEGMIRTMLRTYEDWIDRYPLLKEFEGLSMEDLYDNTVFFNPLTLLSTLSDNKLDENIIIEDYKTIIKEVYIENSKMTTFEFSLFQLLHETYVKKCYIYKEFPFTPNEIAYLKKNYQEVFNKIELVDDVSFDSVYNEVKPTTICTINVGFIMDYMINNVDKDYRDNQLAILLNTTDIMYFDENTQEFVYANGFTKGMNEINDKENFKIATMFNFRLDLGDMGIDEEE